jgi:hypothetical protein
MTIVRMMQGAPAPRPGAKETQMIKKRLRLSALIAGVVFLFSQSALHAEDKYSAGDMLSDCESIIQSSKTSGNAAELELDNTFATGTCWGAFLSLQQIAVTRMEGGKNTMLNMCVPREATLLQIVQVFYLFAHSNPERQTEPFTKVAIAALRSAFPCKG